MTILVLLILGLITVAVAQRTGFHHRVIDGFRQTSRQAARNIPGTRDHKHGEYHVPEPEPLPTVDEIVGYLWALDHDRYVIKRITKQ